MNIKKTIKKIFMIWVIFFIVLIGFYVFAIFKNSAFYDYHSAIDFQNSIFYFDYKLNSVTYDLYVESQANPIFEIITVLNFIIVGGLVGTLIFFIKYLVYVIKRRHEINNREKIFYLTFPLLFSLMLVFLSLFYVEQAVFFFMAKKAIPQVEEVLKEDYINGATDSEQEILEIIKNKERINIVSGKEKLISLVLTQENRGSFYNSIFIPTISHYVLFQNKDNIPTSSWSRSPFWYFKKSNTLVVIDIKHSEKVLKEIIKKSLKNVNAYENWQKHLIMRKDPQEFRIISAEEYTPFYRKKIFEDSENIINENKKAISQNNFAISECNNVIYDNRVILKKADDDYQANCVEVINYNNCVEFKEDVSKLRSSVLAEEKKCAETMVEARKYINESNDAIRKETLFIQSFESDGNNNLERSKAEFSNGVFMRPDSVYIKDSGDALVDFPVTIHEYLHYIVDNPNRDLPEFIDEGITDFLTGKALGLSNYYSISRSGYFTEVQILLSLLAKIPLDDMLNVYINGSGKEFREVFEKYFPSVSYEEFISKGEKIFNTTYEVTGTKRVLPNGEYRNYIGTEEIYEIRNFLGVEGNLFYGIEE